MSFLVRRPGARWRGLVDRLWYVEGDAASAPEPETICPDGRVFRAISHESGAAVAARCGYADQAHLVREIRRFAGRTPTLLAEADGLTAFFRG